MTQSPKLFERSDIIVEIIQRVEADIAPGELLLKLSPRELSQPKSLANLDAALSVKLNSQLDEAFPLGESRYPRI